MISFSVSGDPRGKQRARVTKHGAYTPQETVDAERAIAWECKKAMMKDELKPFTGPVELLVQAMFSIPKSWPKKKIAEAHWHVSRPDADNIVKLAKDALNKVAWKDDAQVARVIVTKNYTRIDPMLIVQIRELI